MNPTMTLRGEGLTWRLVDREIVLLDLQTSKYFSINGSGTHLWELLAAGTTRSSLVDDLVVAYGLTPERAGEDVDRFLAMCVSHDLVQAGPGSGTA